MKAQKSGVMTGMNELTGKRERQRRNAVMFVVCCCRSQTNGSTFVKECIHIFLVIGFYLKLIHFG